MSAVGQTIMIPGFKLIDDILRGLPENARLRGQLEELRAQMAVLQKQNEELKTKVAELSPKEDRLDDDTEKIIDLFFDEPAEWSSFNADAAQG